MEEGNEGGKGGVGVGDGEGELRALSRRRCDGAVVCRVPCAEGQWK
jgi:hypothetical protein